MELALSSYFDYGVNLIVPNVHWGKYAHECDVLIVSKAGYCTEVEIKTSRDDLRNDMKKWHGHNGGHQIKYLYFAVPTLLEEAALEFAPERAGIITVRDKDNVPSVYPYHPKCRRVRDAMTNKAATKMSDRDRYKIARLGALRIWGLKRKLLST